MTGGENKVETGEIDPRNESMTEKVIAIVGVAMTDQGNGTETAIEIDIVVREVMNESGNLSATENTGMSAATGVTTTTMKSIRATGTTDDLSSTTDTIATIATNDMTEATGITEREKTTTLDHLTASMNTTSHGQDPRALTASRLSEKGLSVEVEVTGAKEMTIMRVVDPKQMTIFTTSITEDAAWTVITADMDHPDLTTLTITIDDRAWNIIAITGGDPVQRWDTQRQNVMTEPTIVIQKYRVHRTRRHIFHRPPNQPLTLLTCQHSQATQVTQLDTLPHILDLLLVHRRHHRHHHQFIH